MHASIAEAQKAIWASHAEIAFELSAAHARLSGCRAPGQQSSWPNSAERAHYSVAINPSAALDVVADEQGFTVPADGWSAVPFVASTLSPAARRRLAAQIAALALYVGR